MLFNSFEFALFFPIVTAVYFALPNRHRWWWLLGASCWFYMSFVPVYILILAVTIGVDYVAGIGIEGSQGARRRAWLVASILANTGMLAVFKYFDWLSDNLAFLMGRPMPHLGILLPIGLSFHTFQSLSYTIEVYRGHQAAQRHLGKFALYVMFYPQLVAGPIERPQNLLHQFDETHVFDYDRVTSGLRRMAWGFFKKVVVADRLAMVVDKVYADPLQYSGPVLALATVAFAYQIYCDFAGYSDIALGCAEVMGIHLMRNFNRPYAARSVAEFWRRWHISLSTWFKDYLYIPLGGSRRHHLRNLVIVFLVSGLWHGANWTFVIWGALHAFYQVLGIATSGLRERVYGLLPSVWLPWIQRAVTFGLVCLAWVFFRAPDLLHACEVLYGMTRGWGHWAGLLAALGLKLSNLAELALALLVLELGQWWPVRVTTYSAPRRWALYYALMLMIVSFGVFNKSEFIYFQF